MVIRMILTYLADFLHHNVCEAFQYLKMLYKCYIFIVVIPPWCFYGHYPICPTGICAIFLRAFAIDSLAWDNNRLWKKALPSSTYYCHQLLPPQISATLRREGARKLAISLLLSQMFLNDDDDSIFILHFVSCFEILVKSCLSSFMHKHICFLVLACMAHFYSKSYIYKPNVYYLLATLYVIGASQDK